MENLGAFLCSTFLRPFTLNIHTPQFASHNIESDHLRLPKFNHQSKPRVICFPTVGPNLEPRSPRQLNANKMPCKYLLNEVTKALWTDWSKQSLNKLELELPNYCSKLEKESVYQASPGHWVSPASQEFTLQLLHWGDGGIPGIIIY